MIDFTMTCPTLLALILGAAMPVYLWLVARVPGLAGRNALQFLITFLFMLAAWVGLVWFILTGASPGIAEVIISMCILGTAALFYLEVWALLSRGYTLGLLLTLFMSVKPLTENELASAYRGGDGLDWIMEHRLSGLAAAKLVTIGNGVIALTPSGALIAHLYRITVTILGLRKTG
jgi:hypothetical protein